MKEYYKRSPGAVISTAINKYIYITVNKKFDHHIRISYSKTENVEHVNQIEHDLVREAMKLTGVDKGVEITTIADIPSSGTGLGSSSAFVVGLLNALYAFKGEYKSAETLARQACRIEIDIIGEPIGKQDQYIAAYGGLQYIRFDSNENVLIEPVICSQETKKILESNLMLFYTGVTRKAKTILAEQKNNSCKKHEHLKKMVGLADEFVASLRAGNPVDKFGKILHQNWQLKKGLARGISNSGIDRYYENAIAAGAIGGKILGAGGGGFLLFYCLPKHQAAVRRALEELREEPFKFEPHGSRIIYIEE